MYMMLEESELINNTPEFWNQRPYEELIEAFTKGKRFVIEHGRITGQENIPADHKSEQG